MFFYTLEVLLSLRKIVVDFHMHCYLALHVVKYQSQFIFNSCVLTDWAKTVGEEKRFL